MVGGDGIEPPEPMATDLQSAPLPTTEYPPKFYGGACGARTHDLHGASVMLSQTELTPHKM